MPNVIFRNNNSSKINYELDKFLFFLRWESRIPAHAPLQKDRSLKNKAQIIYITKSKHSSEQLHSFISSKGNVTRIAVLHFYYTKELWFGTN